MAPAARPGGPAPGRGVVVCGGAVVDCIARPFDGSQRGASRTSVPGEARQSYGGVGRNIAEIVARLGGAPSLVSAVGDDDRGAAVLEGCRAAGVASGAVEVVRGAHTATFSALLDGGGELVGAVADMAVFDRITPAAVQAGLLAEGPGASLVVCDANLGREALQQALDHCAEAHLPAWLEPVSVAKAVRGRLSRPWDLVSPNWDELLAMLGRAPAPLPAPAAGELPEQVFGALRAALDGGLARTVLLTMGPLGAVLASAGPDVDPAAGPLPRRVDVDAASLLEADCGAPPDGVPPLSVSVERAELPGPADGRRCLRYRLLRPLASVRDVTGAGDALVGGAAAARAAGWPMEEAVVAGLACAHLTLFADGAVAPFLGPELLGRLRGALAGAAGSRL